MSGDINNITGYKYGRVIHELFHEQVTKNPYEIAILFNEKSLSYYDFNCEANKLSNYLLKQLNERENYIVGVLLERSIEMMVTLFAILKAGCAYLPLNPDDPSERLDFIINDSGIFTLITHTKFKDRINYSGNVICVDEGCWETECIHNPNIFYKEDDLAYMIYTSGTTGYPKGVMIEHKALLNRILWMQKQFPISNGDVILQKTPYTFDVSVWEILWWSITGASVSILNPGEHKDIISIMRNIVRNNVSVIHFVPPMLSVFLEYIDFNISSAVNELAGLKYVFCSGEALKVNQVNKFNDLLYKKNKTKIINLYGPTEAAIDVTFFDCSSENIVTHVPIGKAIDNIEIYILNEENQICDIGKSGELCITGVGLARGYLNRPELNNQKFVQLPWDSSIRMYRTGDLALLLEDGSIEFLGRIDHQVKIKGNRIELGEIESILINDESVKEVVVLAVDGKNDDKFLCAFIVPNEHFTHVNDIRKVLEGKLPDYMLPSHIITINDIPLSTNGKVDRKTLINILDNQVNLLRPVEEPVECDSIWLSVINIIKNKVNLRIPINEITNESPLEEIGIDSLSFLRIIIEIESEFGFEFNMEDLNNQNFQTLGCVISYIKENINDGINK